MASRVMHYCISALLAAELGIDNPQEFMLGGIAPDVHALMGVPKDVTHFKDVDADGESRINYVRFYETYNDRLGQPFYLGYLTHLVSDVVWLQFFQSIVDPSRMTAEEYREKLRVAYRDFERLNGKVIQRYSLQLHNHVIPDVQISGYDVKFLPLLLDLMRQDFEMDETLMSEPLELFQNDQRDIVQFIDEAVKTNIEFLRAGKAGFHTD